MAGLQTEIWKFQILSATSSRPSFSFLKMYSVSKCDNYFLRPREDHMPFVNLKKIAMSAKFRSRKSIRLYSQAAVLECGRAVLWGQSGEGLLSTNQLSMTLARTSCMPWLRDVFGKGQYTANIVIHAVLTLFQMLGFDERGFFLQFRMSNKKDVAKF